MKNKTLQLFLLFSCIVVFFSCGDKKDDKPKAPPPSAVNTYTVKKETAIYYDEYPATVTALDQINITSQVTGYITAIHFKDGQKVVKGQLLYSIDQQIYKANLQQAIADQQVQEANLIKSQKDADRYHELDKNDAVAKQQVDYADAALEVSKKQVAASKANVTSVRSNVKFSTILSPLTGTIGISQVKQGTLVTAGNTILNTVSTETPMAVDVQIDQSEIPRFVKLQEDPSMNAKDSVFTLKLPDNSIFNGIGKVSFLDRAVNPQTGTIRARLIFQNPEHLLKAGMNTNVRVKNNNNDSLFLLIPFKALTEQMGEYFVFVVDDSSKAIQHKVTIGAQINDKVIIKQGLKEGDKVVTDGAQKLKDSTVVQTGPVQQKPEQKGKPAGQ